MRALRFLAAASIFAVAAPAAASAAPSLVEITGTATLELRRVSSYDDPYSAVPTWVEVTFELTGIAPGSEATGAGTATIVDDDRATSVLLRGQFHPPAGSGDREWLPGRAWLVGESANGDHYCFYLEDAPNAPSPRPDSTIAAVASTETMIDAYRGGLGVNVCLLMYPWQASIQDGDISIALAG